MLTSEELTRWKREGFLVVRDVIGPDQQLALPLWAEKLRGYVPRTNEPNPLLPQVIGGAIVATENVADHHSDLNSLVRNGSLSEVASSLLGEPSVLHRDLIRFAATAPLARQVASQTKYVDRHLGCVVAIDPISEGGLHVAAGRHWQQLETDRAGNIDTTLTKLSWTAVVLEAGATLWLHRYTPYRSMHQARTLELIYSAAVQGDLRAAHYVLRRRQTLAIDNKTSGSHGGAREEEWFS